MATTIAATELILLSLVVDEPVATLLEAATAQHDAVHVDLSSKFRTWNRHQKRIETKRLRKREEKSMKKKKAWYHHLYHLHASYPSIKDAVAVRP